MALELSQHFGLNEFTHLDYDISAGGITVHLLCAPTESVTAPSGDPKVTDSLRENH